ncbi:MAG TPA: SppA protein [bacterium]|nr:SppA protein [bacterium]
MEELLPNGAGSALDADDSPPQKERREVGVEPEVSTPLLSQAKADRLLKTAVAEVVGQRDCDIITYNGHVTRGGYQRLLAMLLKKAHPNLLLCLSTWGGDAHAAYRIARLLRSRYKKFAVYVPAFCKSAGTLVAIGGSELVMTDEAELGPLDAQILRRGEIGERASGLEVDEAIDWLQDRLLDSFREYLMDIRLSGMPTKLAAELAGTLSLGLVTPIIAQVDPMRIGEIQRAVAIALEYGRRLGTSLKPGALDRLVTSYPDHSFVIDREEASELFKVVSPQTDHEYIMALLLGLCGHPVAGEPAVKMISGDIAAQETTTHDPNSAHGSAGLPKRKARSTTASSKVQPVPRTPKAPSGAGGRANGPSSRGGGTSAAKGHRGDKVNGEEPPDQPANGPSSSTP